MNSSVCLVLFIVSTPLIFATVFTIWYYKDTYKCTKKKRPTTITIVGISFIVSWFWLMCTGFGELNESEYNELFKNKKECMKSVECAKYFEDIVSDSKITSFESKVFFLILQHELESNQNAQEKSETEKKQIQQNLALIKNEFKLIHKGDN